jgi:hypothetical protein
MRTGVMAYALTPILVALEGKVNMVSFLTGIRPERLVLVHQYVAWVIFAQSWIHTIPFSWREFVDRAMGDSPVSSWSFTEMVG